MSDVISFRLNKNNPREANAIQILKARGQQGHSIRHIITEALLRLDVVEPVPEKVKLEILNQTLCHISQLLEQIGNGEYSSITNRNSGSRYSVITDGFVASVKKSVKLGLKLE